MRNIKIDKSRRYPKRKRNTEKLTITKKNNNNMQKREQEIQQIWNTDKRKEYRKLKNKIYRRKGITDTEENKGYKEKRRKNTEKKTQEETNWYRKKYILTI